MKPPENKTFKTAGGITVFRKETAQPFSQGLKSIYEHIDEAKGCIFASDYEYPGRYSKWDIGFIDPPIEMISRGRQFLIRALSDKGKIILPMLIGAIKGNDHIESYKLTATEINGTIIEMPKQFPEEQRSKQPSIFSVLRGLTALLKCEDEYLSMFGAFGYDLVFQFEPITFKHDRANVGADCHLFFPDSIYAINHQKEVAFNISYDFKFNDQTTVGIANNVTRTPFTATKNGTDVTCDHQKGEFATKVETIREGCRKGDYFEVVPSQAFSIACGERPSSLFQRIRKRNPSPYEFLINLGDEQLVGASPEMFVKAKGGKIETCPISGTIKRGENPMEDAAHILELLNSKKDESELTMCTDVDRNDKSRVCVPGSVQVKARRLVEIYSKLFHTVDHVSGTLLDDCDMFDGFLSHMWACTLTGSPKRAAMQTIENLENSPRRWYGGCVGWFNFDNYINTGITIRTIHLQNGKANVRAGATCLFHSDPQAEEIETRIKAEAFIQAVTHPQETVVNKFDPTLGIADKKILFVDNQDSFVHTLANYVRQTGVSVTTMRCGFDIALLDELKPDLVFISPGPGTPETFGVPTLVAEVVKRNIPLFGVCLGHQGIGQYFGCTLGILETPMHGKEAVIYHNQAGIFKDLPTPIDAARYHSLFIKPDTLPDCLEVTATSDDDVIMGIKHKTLPIASVQFHPESILTLHKDAGLKIITNALAELIQK